MIKRILIVEDDEASQYIYRTLLTKAGYEVEVHRDPHEGLASAIGACPALVMMDVGLPGMDGIELTRRLRAHPATVHVPILVLTVFAFSSEREKALLAGANGFMPKPSEWTEVLKVVQELIGVGGTSGGATSGGAASGPVGRAGSLPDDHVPQEIDRLP